MEIFVHSVLKIHIKKKKRTKILAQWKSVVNGKECSNCFTKHHYIRVFHHFMGDQIPWHHLQGLHVALITIIPLPQTPQPFQFLSAQNPECVTSFSFCKKLFPVKSSQQIKRHFPEKTSLWMLGRGDLGQAPWQEVRAASHPSCWLMARFHQGWQRRHGAHTVPQNLDGSDQETCIHTEN